MKKWIERFFCILFIFPATLFAACAGTVETRQVGEWRIHIADYQTVNREYRKISGVTTPVYGFTNFYKKEVWTVDRTETLLHEVKHILEGHYHPQQNPRGFEPKIGFRRERR